MKRKKNNFTFHIFSTIWSSKLWSPSWDSLVCVRVSDCRLWAAVWEAALDSLRKVSRSCLASLASRGHGGACGMSPMGGGDVVPAGAGEGALVDTGEGALVDVVGRWVLGPETHLACACPGPWLFPQQRRLSWWPHKRSSISDKKWNSPGPLTFCRPPPPMYSICALPCLGEIFYSSSFDFLASFRRSKHVGFFYPSLTWLVVSVASANRHHSCRNVGQFGSTHTPSCWVPIACLQGVRFMSC